MGQFGDIFAAFPQRRQMNGHAPQAVEQVLAEPPLLDQGVQVLVRGGQDADLHGNALTAAQSLETPFLQQSQNLGLRVRGHVPHFVQEQRAAVALLELADPAVFRTRKGAFLVAEQFTFQERLGDRARN